MNFPYGSNHLLRLEPKYFAQEVIVTPQSSSDKVIGSLRFDHLHSWFCMEDGCLFRIPSGCCKDGGSGRLQHGRTIPVRVCWRQKILRTRWQTLLTIPHASKPYIYIINVHTYKYQGQLQPDRWLAWCVSPWIPWFRSSLRVSISTREIWHAYRKQEQDAIKQLKTRSMKHCYFGLRWFKKNQLTVRQYSVIRGNDGHAVHEDRVIMIMITFTTMRTMISPRIK